MNRRFLLRVSVPVACLALSAGALLALRAARHLAETRARCMAILEQQVQLDAAAARLAGGERAREALRRQSGEGQPAAVTAGLAEAFGGGSPAVRETTRALLPGWQARDLEVSVRNVSAARVYRFVELAEAMLPPLRVTRCELQAQAGGTGIVDVVLELTRVERIRE